LWPPTTKPAPEHVGHYGDAIAGGAR